MEFKKIFFSTLAIFLTFTAVYIPLSLEFGYKYELFVFSAIIFTAFSVVFILGLFKSDSDNLLNSAKVKIIFIALLSLVLITELLLNSAFVTYGLALAILGLTLLPALAVWFSSENNQLRVALETVALVFATRVVLLPFPSDFLKSSMFLPTIYTLIFTALILYMTYRKISTKEIRMKTGKYGLKLQLGIGLGIGTAVGFIEYLVLKPQPVSFGTNFLSSTVYIVAILGIMVGVVEEMQFRGLVQSSLEKIVPKWQAVGVASVMFGLMHLGWLNPFEILLAYGAGVVFGYIAITTDSLIAPMAAHGFGNIILYIIAFFYA